jgi:NAD(P)-dependent dehydrogenase (short-subunit alcohol dehydrogenase family)
LNGLTALVTGGRIKIGYEIALKLLRDGAKVYVTSRFFNDTLLRYNQ